MDGVTEMVPRDSLGRAERCACELFGIISASYLMGDVDEKVYALACDSVQAAGLDGLDTRGRDAR